MHIIFRGTWIHRMIYLGTRDETGLTSQWLAKCDSRRKPLMLTSPGPMINPEIPPIDHLVLANCSVSKFIFTKNYAYLGVACISATLARRTYLVSLGLFQNNMHPENRECAFAYPIPLKKYKRRLAWSISSLRLFPLDVLGGICSRERSSEPITIR